MRMRRVGRAWFNGRSRGRTLEQTVIPALRRLGADLAGCRVLEIGVGGGAGAELILDSLHAGRLDTLDLDLIMARGAVDRLRARVSVLVADMAAIPAPDESFHAVVGFGALHLRDDWERALAEVARVVRPDGRYLFEQPTNPAYRWALARRGRGRLPGGFGRDELLAAIDRAGFDVDAVEMVGLGGLDMVGVARRRSPTATGR